MDPQEEHRPYSPQKDSTQDIEGIMLTYIDPRIADNGGYRKQKIGPGTIDITEKKGRPEHIDRMVGRERERGRRTGPEDMDPG